MSVTLSEVARRAGVSLATASRVLNGSTRAVTPPLRIQVLAAAQELNYIPNAHAQALVRATTSTVGVIVHDVSDPYFSEITRGIQRVAGEAGRLVIVCNSYRDPARELEYVALLRAHRVQAIVMAGSGLDDPAYSHALTAHFDAFAAAGGRAIFIGRHHVAGDAVIPDNTGGARALAQALIGMGHRHFGVVSGPPLLTTTRDRLDGFCSALSAAGITLPAKNVVVGDFSRDGGALAAATLIERAPHITALFALNDAMAVGALTVLRARSIVVPAQISVAGFGDMPFTRDILPALSTVRVPMSEMGARAMALALEPRRPDLRVEHVPTAVILRASTAPPPP